MREPGAMPLVKHSGGALYTPARRELPRDPELEELDLASYQRATAAHCLDPHFQLSVTQCTRRIRKKTRREEERRCGWRTIACLPACAGDGRLRCSSNCALISSEASPRDNETATSTRETERSRSVKIHRRDIRSGGENCASYSPSSSQDDEPVRPSVRRAFPRARGAGP